MSDAIWKHEFVSEYKAVDCPRTNKNDYTQETIVNLCARVPTLCLNSRLGAVLEKSVFTLVPSEYCTRAPWSGLMCERCLSAINQRDKLRLLHSSIFLLSSLSLMPELLILDIVVCFWTMLTSWTIMTMGTEFSRESL